MSKQMTTKILDTELVSMETVYNIHVQVFTLYTCIYTMLKCYSGQLAFILEITALDTYSDLFTVTA